MMEQIRRYFRPEQLRELSLIALIAFIFLFFSSQIEDYFSPRIFNRVTSDVAIIAVVALGETIVLLTRNYDLSVGSIVGLTAFFIGKQLTAYPDMLPIVAMLLAIGAGAGLGLLNGLLVSYARIPSIIVTLGTLAIYRAVLVAFPGNKIVVINDLPPWVTELGSKQLFSLGEFSFRPVVVGGLLMFIVFQLVTSYLRFGRQLYAIGSNPEAARIGGLPSQRIVLSAFILCGSIAGLAGFLYLVRFGNLNTAAAQGMELKAIAAAVVGGISTNGGKGTIMGTLLGALMINLLQQSLLRWLVISNFWVDALLGLLILIAVLIDSVIINRLSEVWNRRSQELDPVKESKVPEEKKSHAA
jgi:rhamnose transport system permease protein